MNHQLQAIRHKLLPCQGQTVRLHVRAERNQILDTHTSGRAIRRGFHRVCAIRRLRPPLLLFLPRYSDQACQRYPCKSLKTWEMGMALPCISQKSSQ